MALWLCVGEGSQKGQWSLTGLWTFFPGGSCLWHLLWCQILQFLLVCHPCPSSCCPHAGTHREWIYVSPKSLEGPLRGDAWESCSLLCCPNPHWFLQPEVMWTYLAGTGTLGWVVWYEAGSPHSWGISPIFIHHIWIWDHLFHISVSPILSPPLLCISKNVTSIIPWLLDFHTTWFSNDSGW